MALKDVHSRLRQVYKSSGITERKRLELEVSEQVNAVQRNQPWHIQETLWPLVELTHDEIRAMGEGKRTLEDFKDRFKMNYLDWVRGIRTRSVGSGVDWGMLREIALFNAGKGDEFYQWALTDEDVKLLNLIPQGMVQ